MNWIALVVTTVGMVFITYLSLSTCAFFHDWDKWQEPYKTNYKIGNRPVIYTAYKQQRACKRCLKVVERTIG